MVFKIRVKKEKYAGLFGGMGFHNSEAGMYALVEREYFNQVVCKSYREISPGFMRSFAGFSDWTEEAMDNFVSYYNRMQKWTDTPMYLTPGRGKLHFSKEEMVQYAKDVADKLAYLVFDRGVRHIRYYCFSNELSQIKWGKLMDDLPLFKKYHQLLYQAFQNRGLKIGLLATDASPYDNWQTVDWAMDNMSRITEGYCVHHYEENYGLDDPGFYEWFYQKCLEISRKVMDQEEKRVILGEYGIKVLTGRSIIGAKIDVNQPLHSERSAYSCLMYCEMALAAINAGIYALASWTFCDYPDPYSCAYGEEGWNKAWGEAEPFLGWGTDTRYNKWGMIKWEDGGDYSARDSYWSLGLLTKYFKRNSKLLTIGSDDSLLRVSGIVNRDNSVSIAVINRHDKPTDVEIILDFPVDKSFRRYEYNSRNVPKNKFADLQDYTDLISVSDDRTLKLTLIPESLTVFTTDYLQKDKPIQAQGLVLDNESLSWNPVSDSDHCYYRVYCGDTPDFTASSENQIASTIASSIPIEDEDRYYKIYSVDRSGNCL